jgi:ribose transport system substrate-binding protein
MVRNLTRRGLSAVAAVVAICCVAACGAVDAASGSGSQGAADLDAVKAAVAASKKAPTDITVSTPLAEKPEPGKLFVWFSCDIPSCSIIGEAMERAVTAVGWRYREIAYRSADPSTLVSAMKQALRYDPDYVALTGVPQEAGWGAVVPEYEAAGVTIIASYLAETQLNDTVVANVAGAGLSEDAGRTIADWFIADSGGTGRALLQRVDDFPSLKVFADAFAETVAAKCPSCSVVDVNNTIDEANNGGVVQSVVSNVRAHPDVEYVVSSHAGFVAGLPAALDAAGLGGKVKVAAENADAQTLTALENGDIAAMTGNPLHYAAWLILDIALRHAQGMDFPTDGFAMPMQLLTPDVDFEVSNSLDVPADFEARFKALWGVS